MHAMPPQLLARIAGPFWCLALFLCVLLSISLSGSVTSAWAASPWQHVLTLEPAVKEGSHLMALVVDERSERYYLVDSNQGRLLSFSREGEFLQEYSAGNDLEKPHDMVRLGAGQLLIVERGRNCLTRIDLVKKDIKRFTLSFQGQEIFCDRLEINNDQVYVLDRATGSIFILDQQMQVLRQFSPPPGSQGLSDFKIYGDQLWSLATGDKWLYGFTAQGILFKRIDLKGVDLDFPVSLAIDEQGYFFILDRHQGKVSVLDDKGQWLYSFLGKGYDLQSLSYPHEIRFDPWQRLCIIDQGNTRVQIFSQRGK